MIGDKLAFNDTESSALSLKAEISLAKIFLTSGYSILSCLLLTKEGVDFNKEIDLIQTWHDHKKQRVIPSQVFDSQFL